MAVQDNPKAQNPLMLRFHRLLDAFGKSDDERDFYLDTTEGFMLFIDLDKGQKEIEAIEEEIKENPGRYCLLPKLTFFETKKFMEGFVNEKVYDIDVKEKLLDVIQSKEARENFLEFIYDHLVELEKWQQYYLERSRIRIIEWLRSQKIRFVFEEDLDFSKALFEKLKTNLFETKVAKDIATARQVIEKKADTYWSSEALNPRPKRGRPPKQVAKSEEQLQVVVDLYTTVTSAARHFLFMPDVSASSVTFSAKFGSEEELLASLRGSTKVKVDARLQALSERLESLSRLSSRLAEVKGVSELEENSELFKSVSEKMVHGEEKGTKVSSVFKEILPQKREKKAPEQKKKTPSVKTVTQIQKKRKK